MSDQWIVVPNWDELQHYKTRDPAWIKLYTRLSSNPDWENLTLAQKGLLVEIWIMYARSGCKATLKACAKQIGRSYKASSIKALVNAGFIELSASAPIAQSYARVREEKKPYIPYNQRQQTNPNGDVAPGAQGTRSTTAGIPCPHCGVTRPGPISLAEHIANVHYDLEQPTLEGR